MMFQERIYFQDAAHIVIVVETTTVWVVDVVWKEIPTKLECLFFVYFVFGGFLPRLYSTVLYNPIIKFSRYEIIPTLN